MEEQVRWTEASTLTLIDNLHLDRQSHLDQQRLNFENLLERQDSL